jgi:hypothetical protein
MIQFWRRRQLRCHHAGRIVVDPSFFREQSYRAPSRKDATQWADVGMYQA